MIYLEIYRDICSRDKSKGLSLAMGYFDGVHIGHRRVIESALRYKGTMRTGVLTFDKHPLSVLTGSAPPAIVSEDEKKDIFKLLSSG